MNTVPLALNRRRVANELGAVVEADMNIPVRLVVEVSDDQIRKIEERRRTADGGLNVAFKLGVVGEALGATRFGLRASSLHQCMSVEASASATRGHPRRRAGRSKTGERQAHTGPHPPFNPQSTPSPTRLFGAK